MAIAQLEMVRDKKKKKSLQPFFCNPTNSICLLLSLFYPFLSALLYIASFLLVYLSIHLSLLFHSPCLNLSVSVASRHRAAVLTCASHTWASLLICLRSILKEIPSTYTHLYTLVHMQTHCMRTHTNWQTAKPPRSGLCELFSLRW